MKIDDKVIDKLETLAMLQLQPTEKEELKEDIIKTIAMFEKLAEVDTNGVEPMRTLHNHKQELREDAVGSTLTKEAGLSNSKKADENYFIVPKVVKKTK